MHSTEVLSPRVAILRLRIDRRTTVSIINCYAPTSTATDGEKDVFYKELEEVTKNERSYYKYVVGDFNAVIHEESPATARTGPHGIVLTNENGERSMDLLEACNLFHGNSFFVKNEGRRWTWENPNAATRSEIDHVLTNRKWSLLDVSVVDAFRTGSDHRLVRAKIRLRAKLRRRDHFRPPPIRLPRYDTSAMEVAAVQYAWQEAQDLTHDYDLLVNGLLHCATASTVSGRANSRSRIDGNARTLLQQRAAVYRNSASSLLERAMINKACRIAVRESIQRYKDTRLKEAAEARASLKRCRKGLNDSRSIIAVMRDAMGRPQTSRTKIEEIAVSYYTNLFRSTVSVSRIPTPTQEVAPRIEEWEVERAIRQMKPRKALGPDRISADFLKSVSHTIIKQLNKRFNKYLDAQRIPDQWKKSNTVLLFKKGERDQMKNYRPIALLSQPYKLFTKIILNRLERQYDEYQPVEQAGFRKGFCCMNHIHTITQLIERTREYKQPLLLCFIDYAKAFDSVEHNSVWNALHHAGVLPRYINLLEQCTTFTTIRMFQRELRVPIEKGVRQGDTISPKLFTTALNHAMLQLDWDDKGINIDGRKLSNLRSVDDIVLISQNREELQQMVQELDDVSKAIGLTMNRSKTMVMRNEWADASPITLEGTTLPFTNSYVYLDRLISMDNDLRAEITRRRRCAWAAIGNIKEAAHLVSDKKARADLFDSTVLPALCYASETWAENKRSTLMLVGAQRALERTLLKINLAKQRSLNLRSADMRSMSGIRDAEVYAWNAKKRWAGHVVRRADDRWTTRVTFWYLREVKCTLGRPATRWSDSLKKLQGNDGQHWSQTAQDRQKWMEACARR
nr:unnamed protein product [Haemonchus contortus]